MGGVEVGRLGRVALVALDELSNGTCGEHVVDGTQHRVVPPVVLAAGLEAVAAPVDHLAAMLEGVKGGSRRCNVQAAVALEHHLEDGRLDLGAERAISIGYVKPERIGLLGKCPSPAP
jgi:hypothetical protein